MSSDVGLKVSNPAAGLKLQRGAFVKKACFSIHLACTLTQASSVLLWDFNYTSGLLVTQTLRDLGSRVSLSALNWRGSLMITFYIYSWNNLPHAISSTIPRLQHATFDADQNRMCWPCSQQRPPGFLSTNLVALNVSVPRPNIWRTRFTEILIANRRLKSSKTPWCTVAQGTAAYSTTYNMVTWISFPTEIIRQSEKTSFMLWCLIRRPL